MGLLGGFGIGRWFGFPIRIDYSWFLVAALVVWTFSMHEFPRQLPGLSDTLYLAMGISAALLFFVSVLLHELAHAIVARARGIPVDGIILFIFGGIAQAREEAERPIDEFLLTAAGPLCSVALAGVFFGVERLVGALGGPEPVSAVLGFLALLNFVLAVFNMIPGFPLDGGRIFRSAVWAATGDLDKATRWATWGGRAFGTLLIVFGAAQLFFGLLLAGLWSAFIGWFLTNAATSSYRQFRVRRMLSRIPVSRVMAVRPALIPPELPLDRFVDEYLVRRLEEAYPVVMSGAVLGLVGVGDVTRVPAGLRASTTVGQVMRPTYEVPVARRDDSLAEIVAKLDGENASVLVLEGDRLVGMLSLGDVRGWIQRLHRLGLAGDAGEAA
ncbi:MAG: site-2 protease family protein [Gemmatimonadota bacterium]